MGNLQKVDGNIILSLITADFLKQCLSSNHFILQRKYTNQETSYGLEWGIFKIKRIKEKIEK